MTNSLHNLFASMEADEANGTAQKELEYVFYGKLTDFTELERAAGKETHEQWEIRVEAGDKNPFPGCVRVRRYQGERYVQCIKVITPGEDAKDEVELEVTKDIFEFVKKLATGGSNKVRYIFEIPESKNVWEVDVYVKPDGTYEEWCKIEMEVKEPVDSVPKLPVSCTDVIVNQYKNRTEDEHAKVKELMSTVFILGNQYLAGASELGNATQATDSEPEGEADNQDTGEGEQQTDTGSDESKTDDQNKDGGDEGSAEGDDKKDEGKGTEDATASTESHDHSHQPIASADVEGEISEAQRALLSELFTGDMIVNDGQEQICKELFNLRDRGLVECGEQEGVWRISEAGRVYYTENYRMEDLVAVESYLVDMQELAERAEALGSEIGVLTPVEMMDDERTAPLVEEARELANQTALSKTYPTEDPNTMISLEFVKKLSSRIDAGMEAAHSRIALLRGR
ncbi:hypothetical protein Xoosp14_98 [Xanthomonas phage Xoo-sp14]|nr:hypothetical protein Xoosp14_98 [Xanthomonas phage Xoo-sp14]